MRLVRTYIDYVVGQGRASLPVVHVSLDLTYRCNNRCNMCFLYGEHLRTDNPVLREMKQRQELSLDQWKTVLAQLRLLGVRNLVMTGGEVFMKEGFSDILAFARGLGFGIVVLTNGALITAEQARHLVRVSPWMVRFSLDGDRDTHDAICGARNFDLLMVAIDRIHAEQQALGAGLPHLSFETVIQRSNQDKLHHVIEVAHEKRIFHVLMSNIFFTTPKEGLREDPQPAQPHGWQPTRGIAPQLYQVDIDVLEEELRRTRALAQQWHISLTCRIRSRQDIKNVYYNPRFSYLNKCLYPWLMFRLNPYGDVIPCTGSSLSMGNVLEQSVHEIWNGGRYQQFRRELKTAKLLPECAKCNTLADERWRIWNWLPAGF